jgi:hypothetical protein
LHGQLEAGTDFFSCMQAKIHPGSTTGSVSCSAF